MDTMLVARKRECRRKSWSEGKSKIHTVRVNSKTTVSKGFIQKVEKMDRRDLAIKQGTHDENLTDTP